MSPLDTPSPAPGGSVAGEAPSPSPRRGSLDDSSAGFLASFKSEARRAAFVGALAAAAGVDEEQVRTWIADANAHARDDALDGDAAWAAEGASSEGSMTHGTPERLVRGSPRAGEPQPTSAATALAAAAAEGGRSGAEGG
eukprot:CAMPEP_0206038246 /NCGR_PEP_ID=MMETSP1466-20131121/3982_1 /ASSEMBLY_ACC=CAM_ASM_001126 /TAXON_ID=44452 /ORGANISM="Pavlova gyrans, Strain CCMP608" /LENGTH=139 /DNA_ID=CAMNT_0053412841 /DNA_START=1 /DNA_END=416 /DNA_ORIENTATION=+